MYLNATFYMLQVVAIESARAWKYDFQTRDAFDFLVGTDTITLSSSLNVVVFFSSCGSSVGITTHTVF